MISVDDKALVGQRQGTLLAIEAILVPGVALVVHHVGAVAEPCKDAHWSGNNSFLFPNNLVRFLIYLKDQCVRFSSIEWIESILQLNEYLTICN